MSDEDAHDLDFLAPRSGLVTRRRDRWRARLVDAREDLARRMRGERRALERAAAAAPERRSVLVLAVERVGIANLLEQALAELRRSRHDLELALTGAGDRGKFENL